ncbi:MAG: hypothetical protein V1874_02875 [Spirochaetota bacterium]
MKIKHFVTTAILFISCALLFACAKAERSNENDPKSDDFQISTSIRPVSGSVIVGHEPIRITFEDTMDTASSPVFTGTMSTAADNATLAWTTTSNTNDTLTINPNVGNIYPSGTGATLTVTCNNISGAPITVSLSYTVEYAVYVRKTDSSNSDPGTRVKPRTAIQAGIIQADAFYSTARVNVAGGTYSSNYRSTTYPVIDMVENISVYGGYSDNFSERNVTTYETIIEDTSTSLGSTASPNRVVNCSNTIDGSAANTVIDGFTIKLGGGECNAGIFCQGNITISHNIISGKTSTTLVVTDVHGISILSTSSLTVSPIISYNTIDPGYGNSTTSKTYGIYSSGYDATHLATAQIDYNIITGGNGRYTYGIQDINYSNSSILNNTKIDCGVGSVLAYCINIDTNCHPAIESNTFSNDSGLTTTRYGICEQSSSSNPSRVRNNHFDFSTSNLEVYYYDEGIDPPVKDFTTAVSTEEGSQTLTYWSNY